MARSQRDDLEPVADLHRHRADESFRRRAVARPVEPEQAVDLSDRRREHDRHHHRHRRALGPGVRHRRLLGDLFLPSLHHLGLRDGGDRRQPEDRAHDGPRRWPLRSAGLWCRWRRGRARGHDRSRRRARQGQCLAGGRLRLLRHPCLLPRAPSSGGHRAGRDPAWRIGASGGLLQRRLDLPDAAVVVLQGIIFVAILASETLYGRLWKPKAAA